MASLNSGADASCEHVQMQLNATEEKDIWHARAVYRYPSNYAKQYSCLLIMVIELLLSITDFFQGCPILFLYNWNFSLRSPCNSSFVLYLHSHEVWMKELYALIASHTQTWGKRYFHYIYIEPTLFRFVPQCLWAPLRRVWLCIFTLSHQIFTHIVQLYPFLRADQPPLERSCNFNLFATFFWILSCLSLALWRHNWTQHSRCVSLVLSRGEGLPTPSCWLCRGCWPSSVQGHIPVSCSSCYAPGSLSLPCRADLHLVRHKRTLGMELFLLRCRALRIPPKD